MKDSDIQHPGPPVSQSDGVFAVPWVSLAVLVVIGAMLRLFMLEHQSFWYDECVSAKNAQASLADIFFGRAHDLGTPPLHLLVLHIWVSIFGASDAAIRSLSAAFGIGSIPLFFRIGRRLFGDRVGLIAAAILALSPLHVYFGQEARPYSVATFFVLAATDVLLLAIASPSRRRLWIFYAILTFLSIYSHYYCFFIVFAHLVFILACHMSSRVIMAGFISALTGAAVLYLQWLPSLLAQITTKGNLGRAVETWYLHLLSTPLVFSVGTTLLWKDTVTPVRLILALVALVVFTVPAMLAFGQLRRDRAKGALLLLWLLCPILIPLIISLTLFPFYYVRYALVASPAFYLLIAAGFGRVRRPVAVMLMIGMIVTSVVSLSLYFSTLVKHDWRAATTFLSSQIKAGDVVAFDADIGAISFDHYIGAKRSVIGASGVVRLVPPDRVDMNEIRGLSARGERVHDVRDQLAAAQRIWVVYSDTRSDGSGDYYRNLFGVQWVKVTSCSFRGIDVALFTGRRSSL